MKAASRYVAALILSTVMIVQLTACGDDDNFGPLTAPQATPNPIDQVPVNESVRLPGLGATTDVVFDELGIPHVFAPDIESVLFVQGYLTAQVRFWEMDLFRRVAEGRLSELIGQRSALNNDIMMRTAFTTRDGRRLEEALWEHVQQVDPILAGYAKAYAAGVNAWLADLRAGRNGATLPPEYELAVILGITADELDDWRPQDTIAIGRLQAFSLSETLSEEIDRARIFAALPEAVRRDVFRTAPGAPATVLPVHAPAAAAAPLTALSAATAPLSLPGNLAEIADALASMRSMNPFGSRAQGAGSNNWIISPALSANGHAMLANDPHLQLFNPPIWHMIQLDAGGGPDGERFRSNGVIFPGLPGIILGHNDHGAWGGTVAGFDVLDVYVEDVETPSDYPAHPRTVLFNGQRVPVLRIEETFKVHHGRPVTQVIEIVPHHGPMVPDPNPNDQFIGLAATNMSFRWTGHEITNDSRFLIDLNMARNVNEFRASLRNFAAGAQNWVWADTEGNIAYFPKVLIPQRPPGVVPFLPVSGKGDAEWLSDAQGQPLWLPDDKIPQATNPPQGFLNTSNNDQIGNTLDNDPLNDPLYLAFTADIGFRAQRVQDLLTNRVGARPAGAKMTLEDLSAYQYDHSSLEAARLVPHLLAAADARPDLLTPAITDALQRLRAWGVGKPGSPPYDTAAGIDGHDLLRPDLPARATAVSAEERTDAVATSIFTAWETRLSRAVFTDDFAGTGVGVPGGEDATKALLHILEDIDRTDSGLRVYTKGTNGESTLWDDKSTPDVVETRDEILLKALRDGLDFLNSKFASPEPENWLWGVIHQVRYQHFLGLAGIAGFDLGPFAAPGARFTVNPADFSLNRDDFTFTSGPSERFVAILDPKGIRAVNSLPGGNNGNPGGHMSENFNAINAPIHYGDQVANWINGKTFDYHVSRADVAAHAVHKVRYTP